MSFFIVPTIYPQSKPPTNPHPNPLLYPRMGAKGEGVLKLPSPFGRGVRGEVDSPLLRRRGVGGEVNTLYLSLTSVTPHTHYSQPLTLSLLGQFIGLWLFLTIGQFIAFLESKSLDLTAKSKDLDSVVITALTYLLVSLFSFQLSRYGGQL